MTAIQKVKALKQKNQMTYQQISDELKSLEDQKLLLIKSIFKYSTESQIPLAKVKSIETEDLKISEVSTTFPNEDNTSADLLSKESHLYQKMQSLLLNNGSLRTLSIICQEELGNLDKMLNFPLELKVLNGISKLESLQSLKKQKRKSKKNNANSIKNKSRRIKKNKGLPEEIRGLRNIIDEVEENMEHANENDLLKSLFEECQPEFDNDNLMFPKVSMANQNNEENGFENYFLENEIEDNPTENNPNILNDNQIEQLEIMHNPNDQQPDQQKITELHNYIQMIENLLQQTKQQLNQIFP